MNWLSQTWYTRHPIRWLLLPLSWLYLAIITLRRWFYEQQWLTQHRLPVPVIIVGNISIGGTGKTPFVIWLVEQLRQAGFHPGVISRGYGGQAPYYPYTVTVDSPVTASGDEPLLIASRTQCPVVVAPNRREAGEQLLRESGCDVIIADDGLQHYALQRDIEIVIVDAARQFGNGLCLPAGPLREPRKRLTEVDYVVYNGETDAHAYWMHLSGQAWINIANPNQTAPLDAFSQQAVHAIAGIGNPNRFF
jgi:tetraacyldisaccharide 4'-kinase